jgi:hypothetical protein
LSLEKDVLAHALRLGRAQDEARLYEAVLAVVGCKDQTGYKGTGLVGSQ